MLSVTGGFNFFMINFNSYFIDIIIGCLLRYNKIKGPY